MIKLCCFCIYRNHYWNDSICRVYLCKVAKESFYLLLLLLVFTWFPCRSFTVWRAWQQSSAHIGCKDWVIVKQLFSINHSCSGFNPIVFILSPVSSVFFMSWKGRKLICDREIEEVGRSQQSGWKEKIFCSMTVDKLLTSLTLVSLPINQNW
jgi:hypothetical protein